MKISHLMNQVVIAVILSVVSLTVLANEAKITPLMQQQLSGLKNKEGVMLIVEYAPGMSSTKHRHNADIFVYVLEGLLRCK